jgi:hypothetical protein
LRRSHAATFGHDTRADRQHGSRNQCRLRQLFFELGVGSVAVGIALIVLIPFLRELIADKAGETRPAETPVPPLFAAP